MYSRLPVDIVLVFSILGYSARELQTGSGRLRSSKEKRADCTEVAALSAKTLCVSAPYVWNSLCDNCKEAELVSTFRHSKVK